MEKERQARKGNGAKAVGLGGYLPPTGDLQPFGNQFRLQDTLGRSGLFFLLAEHQGTDAVEGREFGLAAFQRLLAEKSVRFLQQQAATVAGAAIGGDPAPVGHAGQRLDGGLHQTVAGLALEVSNQAKAAVILVFVEIVEPFHGPLYGKEI